MLTKDQIHAIQRISRGSITGLASGRGYHEPVPKCARYFPRGHRYDDCPEYALIASRFVPMSHKMFFRRHSSYGNFDNA